MLLALHVIADLFWIGSIVSVALLLAKGPGDARQRGAAARLIYRSLAAPAFAVAFLAGVVQLGLNPTLYFKATHYMHGKLPLALAIVALHHMIGARARKMEAGDTQDAGPALGLGLAIAGMAVLSTLLVVLKPFLRRRPVPQAPPVG
jgi:putative membrane protein